MQLVLEEEVEERDNGFSLEDIQNLTFSTILWAYR
jgi:hypothetical protein